MYPRFGWYYAVVGLIIQAALLALAIRAYRVKRTHLSLFVMSAVICYVVAASSWFTFPFLAGLFVGRTIAPHARYILEESRYYSDQTFQMLFAAFLIAALVSFTHERSKSDEPNI